MSTEQFITIIRKRLNRRVLLRFVVFALFAATVISVLYGLYYIVRGYAVPEIGYLWIALPVSLLGLLIAALRRVSKAEAARFADETFHLKDILISSMHFKALPEREEAHDLTIRLSDRSVEPLDPKQVPWLLPRRIALATVFCALLMFLLALLPPSDAVLAAEARQQAMMARSEESLEALEEWIEDLSENMDEEEAEEIDLERLKIAVEELEATGDQREALRQLARIEQEVAERMEKLDQRNDEEALRKAAEELEKADETEARQLAEDLKKKDYKEAAEKLNELKQSEAQTTKLSEREKELAKLRAISKRMAAANGSKMDPDARMSESDPNGERSEQSMEGMLGELDENAQMMEGKLEELELSDQENAGQCEAMACQLNEDIDSIARKLAKMQMKNQAQMKLAGLRQQLAMAQSFASGRSPGMAKMPGGQGAGVGTDNSRRDVREALADNGQYTNLTGQKGEGPSLSKIEDAESGSGVSRRTAVAREREFKRQYESFVQRDDIPESVKYAVGNYFESIHNYSPDAVRDTATTGAE
ncbi:hypothetical protein DDZ13_09265 [Coraliomargarita sinensis]|uniref:Uncharacterized protein n=1 Tax=Coraliomargarita sinensis TaxID=2174842 RepID=A0A317ZG10_9BACT|nr:hypothetical protein [Coraliomargarita sinensis]PXA03822.1 hypothetical protein DDZ13_09265 [Coraliomargarita sinensis]